MPWWQPDVFGLWANRITTITDHILYELEFKGKTISVIRSGIGAPQSGDTVLALGCTPCERIIFAGSVGGLRSDIHIGDLITPEFSYSGDGFCRYLGPEAPLKDCFLERIYPDESLSLALSRSASPLAEEAGVVILPARFSASTAFLPNSGYWIIFLIHWAVLGLKWRPLQYSRRRAWLVFRLRPYYLCQMSR